MVQWAGSEERICRELLGHLFPVSLHHLPQIDRARLNKVEGNEGHDMEWHGMAGPLVAGRFEG